MSNDLNINIAANINPIFQKPLAADPNQTKFHADIELKPVFNKWLNTDLTLKQPLEADIRFNEQLLKQEQTRLRNNLISTLKDIQVNLTPSNPAQLLKQINDILKQTPPTLSRSVQSNRR